jgi:hypothetical protein
MEMLERRRRIGRAAAISDSEKALLLKKMLDNRIPVLGCAAEAIARESGDRPGGPILDIKRTGAREDRSEGRERNEIIVLAAPGNQLGGRLEKSANLIGF